MDSRSSSRLLAGVLILALVVVLAACGWLRGIGAREGARSPERGSQEGDARPLIVATTTIVGDVVRSVGGDQVQVMVLMSPGADPHTFEATPRDMVAISRADIVFANGLGLELALENLLDEARQRGKLVEVSRGIDVLQLGHEDHSGGSQNPRNSPNSQNSPDSSASVDPHTWFDPNNVIKWVETIEEALAAVDPAHAGVFAENAAAYCARLRELDDWIQAQVARVPVGQRYLVTDHEVFGYFAKRYGFRQVGTVIPGLSTLGEPSARAVAALTDKMQSLGVDTIFVGTTVNPKLTETLASDLDVRVIELYTGSLSQTDGPAPTYADLIRYDVTRIVEGLQ